MGKILPKYHSCNTVHSTRTSVTCVFVVLFSLANCSQMNQGETKINIANNIQMDIASGDDIRVNNKVLASVNDLDRNEQASKVPSKPIQKRHVSGDKVPCQPLPRELLRKILGPAYNPRYMSFDRPDTERSPSGAADSKANQKDQAWTHQQKNRHGHRKIEAFHVHAGYTRILHEEPVLLENYLGTRLLDVNLSPSAQIAHKQTEGQSLPMATALTKRGTWTRRSKSSSKKAAVISSTTAAAAAAAADTKEDEKPFSFKGHQNPLKMNDFEQVEPVPQEPEAESNRNRDRTNEENKSTATEKFLRLIRGKRNVKNGFPWACDSRIEWLDLGPNHFPRFLRTVVCASDKCWFGHFQCRPKAFTVKILRRRKDSCTVPTGSSMPPATVLNDEEEEKEAEIPDGVENINSHVPPEFREQWIFEERAVTFCCECAA